MAFVAVHNGILTIGGSTIIPFTRVNVQDINNLIPTTNASSGGAFDSIPGIHEANVDFECLYNDTAVLSGAANIRSGEACSATYQVGTGHTTSFSGRFASIGHGGNVGDAVQCVVSAKGKITTYGS